MKFYKFSGLLLFLLILTISGIDLITIPAEYSTPHSSSREIASTISAEEDAGPKFVRTVRVLEAAPLDSGAALAYFDQSLADILGISLPPGSVGDADFERAVLEKFGFEIRIGSEVESKSAERFSADGAPKIFVEYDDFGGSGRAGYISVGDDVWVNVKGIGQTGAGRSTEVGPPSSSFSSHKDGSATLEEAIKEAIYARMSDLESKKGGGRVLAIITTGRVIKYPDGNEVPLALIVRAPVRRMDQGAESMEAIGENIAMLNSIKVLKGDFVNPSNMGAHGEVVDMGCITYVGGYLNGASSQGRSLSGAGNRGQSLLNDGTNFIEGSINHRFGHYLLLQQGIPEADANLVNDDALKERFGQSLKSIIDLQQEFLIDFQHIDEHNLQEVVDLSGHFQNIAADFFQGGFEDLEGFIADKSEYLLSTASHSDYNNLDEIVENFVRTNVSLLEALRLRMKTTNLTSYSKKIRAVASFKNRKHPELIRPNLVNATGELVKSFLRNKNPQNVQEFIDNTIRNNILGTSAVLDNDFLIRANEHSTELFIRAFKDKNGGNKLFAQPKLRGAMPGEQFFFRLTTDDWKSSKDFVGKFIETSRGNYFKIVIPHDEMPVTWAPIQMTPFVKTNKGEIAWLKNGFNLRGPPLMINERLHLSANFERSADGMRNFFGLPISMQPEDLDEGKFITPKEFHNEWFKKRVAYYKKAIYLSDADYLSHKNILKEFSQFLAISWSDINYNKLVSAFGPLALVELLLIKRTDPITLTGEIKGFQADIMPPEVKKLLASLLQNSGKTEKSIFAELENSSQQKIKEFETQTAAKYPGIEKRESIRLKGRLRAPDAMAPANIDKSLQEILNFLKYDKSYDEEIYYLTLSTFKHNIEAINNHLITKEIIRELQKLMFNKILPTTDGLSILDFMHYNGMMKFIGLLEILSDSKWHRELLSVQDKKFQANPKNRKEDFNRQSLYLKKYSGPVQATPPSSCHAAAINIVTF
ncbi:MAG: hypothetical protein A2504_07960 [Bdellovibrionales bacterium RIFOXYD12_FULL_39_22]|nr:MAG: hypothetical protein A2385_13585 [Bdellovibrionales bacterium RIFOXYB1_FULL_39_21]OFZ44865.1 MAG: hypothetical protein A2485_14795 [Bdellovibrionales bacterium RIFOXYC12_FULL_39_17]OFZ49383.1 MAG: hypothetical protein A2404_09130 [Bdellovibrionales bacterium RIFOXYC1_FULL_39_130]OFZ73902.1 MAG: hypothetical protein A2451_07725 [Bdellovibrionales bacterium RIFOXYC2_FULL_39_8]OFZ77104.1 MAG: hypothetical protein A2560_10780 [Bdellovibrionales bacterium RIFOXYD1_FULL_39_84]OFZ95565.1 MAG: